MGKNLGFFQKFDFRVDRLSSALRAVTAHPTLNYVELADTMRVGKNMAEGFSHWLRHAGLVTFGAAPMADASGATKRQNRYELTPFGSLALQYDPTLMDLGTQWLLHYYLVTEHEERSEAWWVLFNRFLSQGKRFTIPEFRSYFAGMLDGVPANKSALEQDPEFAVKTYTLAYGLKRLGLLIQGGTTLTAGTPNLPHPDVVAFMLFDWWQRYYAGTDVLQFSLLVQTPGSLGRVCLLSESDLRAAEAQLFARGYLTSSRTQHDQVTRTFKGSPIEALERYYAEKS